MRTSGEVHYGMTALSERSIWKKRTNDHIQTQLSRLAAKHDAWFVEVIADWQQSRARTVEQDRAYWKDRPAPDPAALFKDYWQWKAAPAGTNPKTADPLKIFRGFWSRNQTEQ